MRCNLVCQSDAMVRYADGPTAEVSTDIAASPAEVFALVTDINLPARFSEEFQRAEWNDGATEPSLGATFQGTNKHPAVGEWTVTCTVTAFEPGSVFEWTVAGPDAAAARWRFTVEPAADDDGSTLRFDARMGPGKSGLTPAIERMPDREEEIVDGRLAEWRGNMQRTVDGIKGLAESQSAE